MKTFGRNTILANYTEKEFLSGDVESKIIEIKENKILSPKETMSLFISRREELEKELVK